MATLEVRGLAKRYGDTTALDGVDLQVDDGEFLVILGPSGAGKTTTLKCIAGLVEPDGGSVAIGGRPMDDVEPYHRNVAMAFESYALYPQRTVFENLASPLRSGRTGTYDRAEQQRRIELVTTTLGIDHLLARFPRELSNGQRQRTALGRVLVRPADLYLLDEPLSHLDAKLRAAMRAELKQLGEVSNTTCLYVTHDYQEALALGDRVAVLRSGRVVQVGSPQEVWESPVDTFVARALGQPEMNLLGAEVADGRLRTAGGAIDVAVPPGLALGRGDRVRLGVRPRALDISGGPAPSPAEARSGGLALPGRVVLSERLGRLVEMSVEIADATTLIVVSSSERAVPEGRDALIHVPLEDVHVFAEGDDGARLGALIPSRVSAGGTP